MSILGRVELFISSCKAVLVDVEKKRKISRTERKGSLEPTPKEGKLSLLSSAPRCEFIWGLHACSSLKHNHPRFFCLFFRCHSSHLKKMCGRVDSLPLSSLGCFPGFGGRLQSPHGVQESLVPRELRELGASRVRVVRLASCPWVSLGSNGPGQSIVPSIPRADEYLGLAGP